MFTLEVIKSDSYQTRARSSVHAAVNRDSSYLDSKSGTVIHSGQHRATCFLYKGSESDHEFRFWRDYGQAAVNAWIIHAVEGCGLETRARACVRALWPEFSFTDTPGNAFGLRVITAYQKQDGGTFRLSGCSWKDIHSRLYVMKQRGVI